VIDANGMHTKY